MTEALGIDRKDRYCRRFEDGGKEKTLVSLWYQEDRGTIAFMS
jgi:hypothetical protein